VSGRLTHIPFIDLKAQYLRVKTDIDQRIQTVLDHGKYIMGPEVAELEVKLARFSGAKHAITVANGTDALQIALMAYGVGPGDAVFVPSFTFTATAEAVLILGAEPVFVDVLPDTFNMDGADLEAKLSALRADNRLSPKGVIGVGLFGQPADYTAIGALAGREGLFVVDDAAQSFGGKLNGRGVGVLANVTTTSFFPAKPLGCYGDGGALFTDDDEIAAVARSIREHGKGGEKYEIVRVGLNSRLDTIQAAILLAKLDIFESEIDSRNRIADLYQQGLNEHVKTPSVMQGARSVWAQYTVRHEQRDQLAAHLKAAGIPTAVYYPRPMHLQTAYKRFGAGLNALPVSEVLSREVLSLPMHPYLEDGEVEQISNIVRAFKTS